MGKSIVDKPFVLISGLALNENNRGTAALGYGAISFLQEKGLLSTNQTIIKITECKLLGYIRWMVVLLLKKNRTVITIGEDKWNCKVLGYPSYEKNIVRNNSFFSRFTILNRIVRKTSLVAAINGGDGFSDIYGADLFKQRLPDIEFAIDNKIPLIMLPQTIGPFKDEICLSLASSILKYSFHVYIRDSCFVDELEKMGVKYELTNDLSFYMKPEPWDIDVNKDNAVGLNISGLAWDNNFHTLSEQFDNYKELIRGIITMFQNKGKTIYLIPHSYNYYSPELFNDDLKASKDAYNELEDKTNVVLIDKDLKSPQIKFLISQMSFFVGTRMHANYAAIFTKVPVFGLAYSYKFKGAFENNGIYNRTASIIHINKQDIESIINAIETAYNSKS